MNVLASVRGLCDASFVPTFTSGCIRPPDEALRSVSLAEDS